MKQDLAINQLCVLENVEHSLDDLKISCDEPFFNSCQQGSHWWCTCTPHASNKYGYPSNVLDNL